ncbi:MAG: hypothetical protein IPL65_09330 [Lewinellaceae bacterium]|nr:hypothetical protein [Lewinellaceae bacterium]
MLRIIIAFILLMHGLIHLMGFAKAYGYAALSQLTQPIAKPAGLLWLLTTLLLSVAALLMWQQHPYWWVLAFPGILFSQILIISHWTDARFGTVANIIGLLFALTAAGTWQFDQMVAQEKTTLLEHINKDTQYLLPERVASLPPIVQQWLQTSAAVGQPIPNSVYLEQEGEMRPKPNGK